MAASVYELRASGAAAWVKCHAYPRVQTLRPEIGDTTVREEGTAWHWGAYMTSLGHPVSVGMVAENGVALTEEMVDAIEPYLSRLRTWPNVKLESPVHAPRVHPSCGGTTDAWSWHPADKRLRVGDGKFGYRYVDPWRHWQMIVYACGLLDMIGVISDPEVIVEFHIYQPRAYKTGGPWETWKCHVTDLYGYIAELSAAAVSSLSDKPTAKVGPYCGDCNGRYDCETLARSVGTSLEMSGELVMQDLPPAALEVELQRVEHAMQVLEARRTGLVARAEHFLTHGQPLKLYAMERSKGLLKWNEGTEEDIRAVGELFQVEITKPGKLITPTQAKELIDPVIIDQFCTRIPGAFKLEKHSASKVAKLMSQHL